MAPVFVFSSAESATVITDSTDYPPGSTVMITGSGFGSFENVELQVTHLDGDPVGGDGHDPWTARSSFAGGFATYWVVPFDDNDGEVLLLTATGLTSGFTASTTFTDAVNVNLDQLHNGNASSSPEWANGNINTSNSCYAENDAVPFRYFIKGLESGSTHYFTIQMEWTKGGIHAYDYLVSYDLTEGAKVDSAGGPCGTISTAPPDDCDAALDSFPFPDPTLTSNYSPTNPPDSFPPVFSLSTPANLKFYNATIDSLGPYFLTGSASDRELNLVVTFTVEDTGSVGFYWGGHMAHGVPGKWGSGQGSGSVSGAPYHMRSKDLDGSGGKNQDRSIQNGALCLPPQATFSCASSLLSCGNLSSSCTADDFSGNLYTWQIVGGTIDSGQGTATIYYTATDSEWVYITLEACDTTGGCPGDFCCNDYTDSVEVQLDTTDPQFVNCPGNATFQCDAVPAPPTDLIGTDNCDPSPTITYLGETTTPGTCPQSYTITRRWEICDDAGNCDTCTQVLTVLDSTKPVFTNCPANTTVQCYAVPPVANPTATDNCDPNPVETYLGESTTPGSCPQSYTLTRKWVAADACGNKSDTCRQVITVVDTNKPYFVNCPSNMTIACNAVPTPVSPTAADSCDSNPVETFLGQTTTPGSCPQSYIITRKWIATDACGNKSDTCRQEITVVDTNKPYFVNCPSNVTVACNAVPTPASPTAADSCDSNPVETYLGETTTPGSCPQSYTLTRKWVATDACGNISDTCVQVITVNDNIKPVITNCPANDTVQCSNIPAAAAVIATDICDPNPTEFYLGETINPGNCPYTITRKWVAVDACGNVSDTCVQTITVIDTNSPSITCPSPVAVQCLADVPAPNVNSVIASDSCGMVTVTHVGDSPSGSCPTIITRTYKATDPCGNFATCTQIITVDDTTAPVLSGCPSNASFQCYSNVPSPANVTANDNCNGPITPVPTEQQSNPGSSCNNIITRTWTATDSCGNVATCTQTITVNDNIPPVPTGCPANA
ncbi:MAG TPA: hypothetical protein VHP63_01550, partial [candidate division Zixibacteria bacterium]|nr:hypothetical protein [candidate division Zixibacteria bacterium]